MLTHMTPDPVRRRASPTQARSAATVQRILDAATEVLVDKGLQGFNTNLVASRAGVNVGTLYHYFADKQAILRQLFERDEVVRATYFTEHLGDIANTTNIDEWIRDTIRTLLRFRAEQPASVALRRACRAVPELIDAEVEGNNRLVRFTAEALRSRYPHLSAVRARAAARTIVESGAALLDYASANPAEARGLTRELITIMSGYLAELEKQR